MIDLRYVARALGGEVAGHQVLAPGPGHSQRDRSLAVRLYPAAPDGFVAHSHAGDDWRECRDHVRRKLGLPAWEPGDDRHEQRTISPAHVDKWDFGVIDAEVEDRRPRSEDDLLRIKRAVEIHDEAADLRDTAAEKYLRARALELPDDLNCNARCSTQAKFSSCVEVPSPSTPGLFLPVTNQKDPSMTRYLRSLFVILFAALAVLGTIGSTQAAGGSGPPDAGSTLSTRAGIARLAREILRGLGVSNCREGGIRRGGRIWRRRALRRRTTRRTI